MGGAGTGKTTTALWTARTYLETAPKMPPTRVLFLTFSRSAVAQILSRTPGILANSSNQIEIRTFHSLSYWLLRAFGRYDGYGTTPIAIQSNTRVKLRGDDARRLRYDDLIPGAIQILKRSEKIRRLIASRWGLLICDEAQDTSSEQWNLIQLITPPKLILLGDSNQMIYSSFVPGVSAYQFQMLRQAVNKEIVLLPQSHRDPSGVIPSAAEAIRRRNFRHEAVVEAIRTGRLYIHFGITPDAYQDILVSEINKAKELGLWDVGIFAYSNVAVAEMAELLNRVGIDHALIGIPEAHAEALGVMAAQCAFAAGLAGEDYLRESLALFLTANVRGKNAPPMALALIGTNSLPVPVDNAIRRLEQALKDVNSASIGELGEVVMRSWDGLGFTSGFRPWRRAAQHFARLLTPFRGEQVSEEMIRRLLLVMERSQTEALIDLDYTEQSRVRLMTYHQTKSRESDVAVHVYLREDFFGFEEEPFEEASRLLNVAMTRARKRLVLILPDDPHPLVRPFNALREIQESVLPSW